jgi:hypothetical protein
VLRFANVSLIRRLLRARRRAVAGLLMASLVTTMLGPWVHADDGHDADFAAPIVHDASQHRWTADGPPPAAPEADQHCVACHVVRLVREGHQVALAFRPTHLSTLSALDGAGHPLFAINGPPLPARAPPASSFV